MVKTLTLPKLIRRLLVGLSLAALLVVAMTTGGAAANGSSRQAVPSPGTLYVGCPNDVTAVVTWSKWNEYVTTTFLADGTVVQDLSGVILATVTNQTSGKSINLNASGPEKYTFYKDGSYSTDVRGSTLVIAPPSLESELGIPYFALVDGNFKTSFDPSFHVTSVSLNGRVTDLCAAVS
jgi:hypothetical protein